MERRDILANIDNHLEGIYYSFTKLRNLWQRYGQQVNYFFEPPSDEFDKLYTDITKEIDQVFAKYGNNSYLLLETKNFLLDLDSYLVDNGKKLEDEYQQTVKLLPTHPTFKYEGVKSVTLRTLRRLEADIKSGLEEKERSTVSNYEKNNAETGNTKEKGVDPIRLHKNAQVNQIASIFYELREKGYIYSSTTNLIRMIISVFRSNDNSLLKVETLKTYMKPGRPITRPQVLPNLKDLNSNR